MDNSKYKYGVLSYILQSGKYSLMDKLEYIIYHLSVILLIGISGWALFLLLSNGVVEYTILVPVLFIAFIVFTGQASIYKNFTLPYLQEIGHPNAKAYLNRVENETEDTKKAVKSYVKARVTASAIALIALGFALITLYLLPEPLSFISYLFILTVGIILSGYFALRIFNRTYKKRG